MHKALNICPCVKLCQNSKNKETGFFGLSESCFFSITAYPTGSYMFKVNNKKTRTRCEIRQWRRSAVFIANFEHITQFALVFLLLTLSR